MRNLQQRLCILNKMKGSDYNMFNNRPINQFKTNTVNPKRRITRMTERINISKENIIAKEYKTVKDDGIIYSTEHPLYLRDGTAVYGIKMQRINRSSSQLSIKYRYINGDIRTARVRVDANKRIHNVEGFLENSSSIGQIVTIDLDCN